MINCPICGLPMEQETKYEVVIDVCRDHGVWLDNGELEKMIRVKEQRMKSVYNRKLKRAKHNGVIEGAVCGLWALL
jgi:Zn-finger nucleic acid-binding protein